MQPKKISLTVKISLPMISVNLRVSKAHVRPCPTIPVSSLTYRLTTFWKLYLSLSSAFWGELLYTLCIGGLFEIAPSLTYDDYSSSKIGVSTGLTSRGDRNTCPSCTSTSGSNPITTSHNSWSLSWVSWSQSKKDSQMLLTRFGTNKPFTRGQLKLLELWLVEIRLEPEVLVQFVNGSGHKVPSNYMRKVKWNINMYLA